jgi:hypothetical protein
LTSVISRGAICRNLSSIIDKLIFLPDFKLFYPFSFERIQLRPPNR